jgi:hypothetical protein
MGKRRQLFMQVVKHLRPAQVAIYFLLFLWLAGCIVWALHNFHVI